MMAILKAVNLSSNCVNELCKWATKLIYDNKYVITNQFFEWADKKYPEDKSVSDFKEF